MIYLGSDNRDADLRVFWSDSSGTKAPLRKNVKWLWPDESIHNPEYGRRGQIPRSIFSDICRNECVRQ
jgi:hypothetical protein